MTQLDITTAAGGEQVSPPAVGLDVGSRHERDADEVAHALVRCLESDPDAAGAVPSLVVATHFVGRAENRHVALTVSVPAGTPLEPIVRAVGRLGGDAGIVAGAGRSGPEHLVAGAAEALEAWRARTSGRAVHFPGVRELTGEMTVGELLARSAIDEVRVLAAGGANPATRFVTREFVRPVWVEGRLLLHAQPARGGVLVPFEVPNPTPCCVDHG